MVKWIALCGFAFLFAGCGRNPKFSAEETYKDSSLKAKRGDLNGAYARADAGLRNFPALNTEWHWRFLVLEGDILVRQGRTKESLSLLQADIPPEFTNSDMEVSRKLSRAAAYSFQRQFSEADACLAEAKALATASHPEMLGDVSLRQGTIAFLQDDSAAAESAYRAALQYARKEKDQFLEAAALGSLGLVATKQEHYDESIDWDRAAMKLSQSVGAQGSVARILGNMGWSYFEMGDYENALSLFQQAETSATQAGLLSAQLYWRINTGVANYYLRDYAAAVNDSQVALEMSHKLDDKIAMTQCLNNLSYISIESGQLDLAEKYNQEADRISKAIDNRVEELASLLIEAQIQSGKQKYPDAEKLLQQVMEDPATQTSMRWEAQARLAEVLKNEGRRTDAERGFRESLALIEKARSAVKTEEFRLSFLSSAILFYDNYIDFLISEHRTQDALAVAESSRAKTLSEGPALREPPSGRAVESLQPQQIARRVGATLLFYRLGQKQSYLWGITPQNTILYRLPPATEIDSIVRSYQAALMGPRDILETGNASGTKLFDLLVAPAIGAISNGSRVVILPDGSLYGLNFDTLLSPTPKLHYWIEDVIIDNSLSLSSLAKSRPDESPKAKTLLLIGDPVSPGPDYPNLAQAGPEMEKIQEYFPPSFCTVFSGSRATAAAYVASQPGHFDFIHFVAHGTASRVTPLDSAVILSKDGESYKLYARDIVRYPLQAELVTISACRGAGERTYSGEGLVGLTWAFLKAGANNVVAALWEVSDNSTPQLMDRLYSEMKKNVTPDIALRNAKLSLLRSDSVYRKPFYWAAFQIYRN